MKRFVNIQKYIIFLIPFIFSACMSNIAGSIGVDTNNIAGHNSAFTSGDYEAAADISLKHRDDLLSNLQAGNDLLYAKKYKKSIDILDEAELKIKQNHEAILASTSSEYLARILVNDAALDYKSTITDGVMLNTYKAINYMALGEMSNVRVEFNRAIDRQRRAKETYAKEISKQNQAIKQEQRESENALGMSKTINNKQISKILQQNYHSLYSFKTYSTFINPFSNYLAGIFFLIDGDYSKASYLLKESYLMTDSKTAKKDFLMVEDMLNGKKIDEKYVWVIYENGLGMLKEQFKINIPMFLFSNNIIYTGIALPKMRARSYASFDILLLSKDKQVGKTEIIADMDKVIMSEFKHSYSDVVTRAVLSTFVKTYTQYRVNKDNQYFGLAMSIFQQFTTQADTRIWSTMPKNFQVARVKMPSDYKLSLKAGHQRIDVDLDAKAKHSIVYVRIPTSVSIPSVTVMNF